MSSWALAQERSIYSEKGQTGVVPGQHGVHAECLGNISATVCAFKLNSWPFLPAFLPFPFFYSFPFSLILTHFQSSESPILFFPLFIPVI